MSVQSARSATIGSSREARRAGNAAAAVATARRSVAAPSTETGSAPDTLNSIDSTKRERASEAAEVAFLEQRQPHRREESRSDQASRLVTPRARILRVEVARARVQRRVRVAGAAVVAQRGINRG